MIICELTDKEIDISLYDKVKSPKVGAIVQFLGTTRDHFNQKKVVQLEYEAYESMALKVMNSIAVKVTETYSLDSVVIVHRLGIVPPTQASILVICTSVHRKESIHAVEAVMDLVKEQVPIWKKEVYEDGYEWKRNEECLKKL